MLEDEARLTEGPGCRADMKVESAMAAETEWQGRSHNERGRETKVQIGKMAAMANWSPIAGARRGSVSNGARPWSSAQEQHGGGSRAEGLGGAGFRAAREGSGEVWV